MCFLRFVQLYSVLFLSIIFSVGHSAIEPPQGNAMFKSLNEMQNFDSNLPDDEQYESEALDPDQVVINT